MSKETNSGDYVMQVNYDHQEDPFPEETIGEESPIEELSEEKAEVTTEKVEEKPKDVEETPTEEPKDDDDPKPKEVEEKPVESEDKDKDEKDEKDEKSKDNGDEKEKDEKEPKDELPKELTPVVDTLKPLLDEGAEIKSIDDVANAVKSIASKNEELKTKNTAYINDNEKIRAMFQKNPDIASMLESLANGDNPLYSMGFIKDIIDSATDEEIAEYEKGNKARNDKLIAEREAIKKYEELSVQMEKSNKEFDKNLKESDKAVRDWAKENGVTEERADEEIKLANKLFSEKIFKGKIDADVMDVIHTYVNRDALVKDAMEAGRINAKNEKIVSKKLDIKDKTDGLPKNSASDNPLNTKIETEEQRLERMLGYRPRYNQ